MFLSCGSDGADHGGVIHLDDGGAWTDIGAEAGSIDAGIDAEEDVFVPQDDVDMGGRTADIDAAPVEILEVGVHKHPTVGLAAILYVTTSEPARLEVTAVRELDGQEEIIPTSSDPATSHQVTILGMRSEQIYQLQVVATDAQGGLVDADSVGYTTEALPEVLPSIVVVTRDLARMQLGYTMISLHYTHKPNGEVLFALDDEGQVVWYLRQPVDFFQPLSDNRAFFQVRFGLTPAICLTALTGDQEPCFQQNVFGFGPFHHDFSVTTDGTILALTQEVRTIDGYETPGGRATYKVAGDVVGEFSSDGELLRSYSMLDLLDPYQIGSYFHGPWWGIRAPGDATKDWSHANAVETDPKDGAIIVSLLGLSKIVKVNRQTGALMWRLGPDGDFALQAGGRWFTEAHSPVPGPGNTVLLYNNIPSEPPFESRIVEYTLSMPSTDPGTWTATQTFEHSAAPAGHSLVLGTLQRLKNGNILYCDGAIATTGDSNPISENNHSWARIIELVRVPGGGGDEVLHLDLLPQGQVPGGIQVSHVDHFDSLYPAPK